VKVCFVRLPVSKSQIRAGRRYNRIWPPLSLLNCAALAREAGAQVSMVDLQVERVTDSQLQKIARTFDLIFVTTSSLDRWQCPHLDITESVLIVRKLPRDKVYIMGAHGTMHPKWILDSTMVRGVVRGEPEETVRELVTGNSRERVDGLSYQAGERLINNPNRDPIDLKSLPLPAYDLVDLRQYSYDLLGSRLALLETTRGCSFSCKFCFKMMYGKGVREKAFEQVSREIEWLVSERLARAIYFFDLEFTLVRDTALHVCDVMKGFHDRMNTTSELVVS